jgi:hypothetical protein
MGFGWRMRLWRAQPNEGPVVGPEFKVSATVPVDSTTYRNHGDYVSQMGGRR